MRHKGKIITNSERISFSIVCIKYNNIVAVYSRVKKKIFIYKNRDISMYRNKAGGDRVGPVLQLMTLASVYKNKRQ